MISGARLDLCDLIDGNSMSSFDTTTGHYEFKTTDIANYPPGDYVFRITGTSGLNSNFVDITMTLLDPCATDPLTLLENPFVDATYILRDPQMMQNWDLSTMVSKESAAECGPFEIIFFNDDAT